MKVGICIDAEGSSEHLVNGGVYLLGKLDKGGRQIEVRRLNGKFVSLTHKLFYRRRFVPIELPEHHWIPLLFKDSK